jgi:aspartyl-tRNA(Asn)/glutamyl-tRNA(Gln) amidotransferase subunit A
MSLQEHGKNSVIGIPKGLFAAELNKEVKERIESAVESFRKLGFTIREISMPMISYGISVYYLIAPSETSSNLARYDAVRYGGGRELFTPESMRRIMIGTYSLSAGYYDAYYKKAQQARTLFIREYEKAFEKCDVIFMPVTPAPPSKLGECIDDPIQNMLVDIYTTTQNPVGVPSLAVPCGFTSGKLPVGFQLVGRMFDEKRLFQVGHAYQGVTSWHTEMPPILKSHYG